MARTYKDLTDHAVDRVTGGAEEDYARGHARRVRHMEAGGRAARIRLPRVRVRQLCDAGRRIQVDNVRPRALAGHRGQGVEARRDRRVL